MRKSSVQATFDQYEYWLGVNVELLARIINAKRVVGNERDKKELIEAFVFKLVAIWEVFIQDLMIDLLNRDSSQYADYTSNRLQKHLPRPVCRAMIEGLGYYDFRGVADIKRVAKNILVGSNNAFKAIPQNDGEKIDEFARMRNYLAHYSTVARRNLMKSYKRIHGFSNFREPADFLYAYNPRTKALRLVDYVTAYESASAAMKSYLGIL